VQDLQALERLALGNFANFGDRIRIEADGPVKAVRLVNGTGSPDLNGHAAAQRHRAPSR
jgi:hypothetical protein